MKEFLKKLFCRHKWGKFICTYYEGFPPEVHGYYECEKCGKEKDI